MKNYSFIIPHKNAPDLLERCIASIPQREDIEIIVVDDNSSSDKKPNINCNNVIVVYLSAEQSKGAGRARNVGMAKASGKWLLFADCDDFYENGFLEKLDVYKDKIYDIVYFTAIYDKLNGTSLPIGFGKAIEKFNNSSKTIKDIRHLGVSSNVPWNKMLNRQFLLSIDAEYEEIPRSNDAWFANYVGIKSQHIAAINIPLYHYQENEEGITKSVRPISHHYISLRSRIKRNKLKYENGMIDTIQLNMLTNKKRWIQTYGRFEYIKLLLFYYTHDIYVWKSLLYRAFNKG